MKFLKINNSNKEHKILFVFIDIITDMFNNKELNHTVIKLFSRGKKLTSCFYHTILFCCTKKYETKFYTLLCYENSK